MTKEVSPQAVNFTWSAKVEVLVEGDDAQSQVSLNGSITGMGPVQKGHLKGQVGALKNKIDLAAQARPISTDAVSGVSAELERLAELHEKGALSAEEFAEAKARVVKS